jgi:hypothetical protein
MLVNDPGQAREHIALLVCRGCTAMAAVLNDTALERRWIDQTTHEGFRAQLAELPQISHQVFGIFLDSVITSLHFTPITDRTLAREAFRQAVRWIEIETSSQCNRRCAYCPNSKFDRISHNDFLDMAVYEKMVRELAEIDYDGDIKFVGNNEFFMHSGNRRYVEYARLHLSRARMTLFSNGDYLKKDDLEWASAMGIGQLIVTLHPGPTKHYNDLEVLRRINLFQTQTGLPLQLRSFKQGQGLNFVGVAGKTIVLAGLTDLEVSGHNWTGLLPGGESHVRTDPCTYPIRQFVVNYLSDIFMCCIAFKDRSPENEAMGAITGNLSGYDSVFQAYTSPGLVAWRRSLFNNDVKADPCKTCSGHADYVEAGARPLVDFARPHITAPV